MSLDDEILQEFLAESWENLGRLDTEIVVLEKQPDNHDLLASIFRTIHTIKGTCGFIGLNNLGAVAHSAENVLGQMRDGKLTVTQNTVSSVLEAVDRIKELLHGLEESGNEPDLDSSELILQLNEIAETAGMNRLIDVPTTAPQVAAPQAAPVVAPAAVAPPVAIPEAIIPEPEHVEETHATAESASKANTSEGSDETGKKSIADLSIRVNVDVLDRLMNLVGELVLTRNQLLQMVRGEDESKYSGPITHLNRVTTDLQEGVMKTRMQPIGNAWSKLPRLVRDLAQQTGKQIQLDMVGQDTELDRTVLDAIKDPLTHMVRNSADHGLEPSHVRRAAGKSETGRIKLDAYHEGGHVIICIEDDGAGINLTRVREKAIAIGLVSEAEAKKLTEKEIVAFIFRAGFSTAEKISSVSGRGVGMDVVRTQIERIGGTVDMSTRKGQGTKIRIKIPLTLAIISALVVDSHGLPFAIPQLGVVELVRLPADEKHKIERINKNEVFRLRNRLLPLVHLETVLGLDRKHADVDRDINIVVVQVGEEQFGLIVSEVHDTEEIVVKPVGHLMKDIEIYQGTTILGDGRVIMILDVAGIAAQFAAQMQGASDKDKNNDSDNEAGQTTSILLFSAGGQTMAVPLSLVARLEEFSPDMLEQTGERIVVQYRDDLLPLMPVHGHEGRATRDPQPVIVFSEGQRSMGLMVDQIQDIIEDRLMIRMQSRRPGVMGTAIINNQATDILDLQHYIIASSPDWFDRPKESSQARILVMDDSIFIRQIVTTALETDGYRVLAVPSATHGVELIEAGQKYDLIISDIEMPMMDGFEFAEWYRERNEDVEIPLIALTSLWTTEHQAHGQRAGFDRYLKKFDPLELQATVQELLQIAKHRGAR